MEFSVVINKCPNYAHLYKYIIAKLCHNELWFYDAVDDKDYATKIICDIDEPAVIITNSNSM